jgi:hypothetical protein
MDNRLLELRADNYAATITFHRVASELFTVLRDRKAEDESAPIVIAIEEAAIIYANALDDLLAYLKTLEQSPAVQDELRRTERVRGLLQHETQLMTQVKSD